MAAIDWAIGKVSLLLAWIACVIIVVLFVMIVVDVSMRTYGLSPPLWTSSVVEYALLYVAMLPAGFLVRERGHVAIEAVVSAVPRPVQIVLAKFVYLTCIIVSFGCAWFAWNLMWEAINSGALDVRGVDMPSWLQFAPLTLGFTLVGLEFLMFLIGRRHYYTYDLGEVKDSV